MSQWLVLWRRELLELRRSYRWIWVPLVFLALGAMQPLASYYMPQILDSLGGLPEGAVIEIPPPAPGAAMASALNQLGTLGVLVLVLVAMGSVATERSTGQAAMILVKPVSHAAFITVKWAAYALLMLAAVIIGQLGAYYYTDLLIGPLPLSTVLGSAAVFAAWLGFVLALPIALGVFFRSAAAVAVMTVVIAVVLSTATSLLGDAMAWSPALLAAAAAGLLTGAGADGIALPLAVTAAATAAILAAASAGLRRRPLAAG
ncbi:MAG: hypothetical protein KIS96_15600 [Bauldia sp.]|nr:hypothetical protein [Bauldia sp.]